MLRRGIAVGLALFVGIALAATPAWAGVELGGETPQAVFARMSAAAEKGDLGELVACVDPDSRAEITMAMVVGATMMVAFMDMGSGLAGDMAEGVSEAAGSDMKPEEKVKLEQQKAEAAAKVTELKTALSGVFKKYGLPDLMDPDTPAPKEGSAKEMLAKVDQPALAADLSRLLDKMGDKSEKKQEGSPLQVPKTATDYAISGDHATAKAGGETLEFVKVDGRWFVKPPEEKPPAEKAQQQPET